MKSDREYRAMQPMSAMDEMVVEGYATTFNQPYLLYRDGDYELWESVDKDAFTECDMSDVIFQYDHCGRVFARNKNGTMMLTPDENGLKVRAMLGGTEIGKQLYEEIKGGYTDKMSFGFIVSADERTIQEDLDEGTVRVFRTIKSVSKLFDVSAVSIPANDATSISARTYGDGVIAEAKEQIEAERLRRSKKEELRKLLGIKEEESNEN